MRDTGDYRGKRIDNGEWVKGWLIKDESGEVNIVNNYGTSYSWDEVDPKTVGLVFPFKDVTEKELYPGDIIKTVHTRTLSGNENSDPFSSNQQPEEYEKIGVLEYYEGYNFGPRLRWKKGHMMIPNTSTLWRMKAIRLGNRWDNPDLLGGRTNDKKDKYSHSQIQ